jgi:hypothetical protein
MLRMANEYALPSHLRRARGRGAVVVCAAAGRSSTSTAFSLLVFAESTQRSGFSLEKATLHSNAMSAREVKMLYLRHHKSTMAASAALSS